MTQAQIFSLIRWGMTIAGTIIGNDALAAGDTQTAIVGGISAILSIIWSFKDGTKSAIVAKAAAIESTAPSVYDPGPKN